MRRNFGEAVTIISLLLIASLVLFGGLYLGISVTGEWPTWAGNVFAAFAGGILALLGTMFAARVSRQLEYRRLEHEQSARLVQPYRQFLISLYHLLSRKVYAQATENKSIAAMMNISPEDVQSLLHNLPPLASSYLVQNQEFQDEVELSILDGIELLQASVDNNFLDRYSAWSENSRELIKELNEYENQAYQ